MQRSDRLSLSTRVVYGSGDLSISSLTTFRLMFHAVFLVGAVGLDPRLAAVVLLVGALWDAGTDLVVGPLSDRTRTRYGRRRPWLIAAAVPLGLAGLLLGWVPPWEGPAALTLHFTLAYVFATTLQTLVAVPLQALTPELTPDYDERTELTSWRRFFAMLASLALVLVAPEIVAASATEAGGYLSVALLFGAAGVLPPLLVAAVVREDPDVTPPPPRPLPAVLASAWENVPFRHLALLYALNWVACDLVVVTVPLLARYHLDPGAAALSWPGGSEAVALAALLVAAVAALPIWTPLGRRVGKRGAYLVAILGWAMVQVALIGVAPGEGPLILGLVMGAGLGVSAAHVLPDSMIPDVVDVDELRTGERNEGLYYGIANLLRKLVGTCAILVALWAIGGVGSSDEALRAIRILLGGGAILLLGAAIAAWAYPLTRSRHDEVRAILGAREDISRSGGSFAKGAP